MTSISDPTNTFLSVSVTNNPSHFFQQCLKTFKYGHKHTVSVEQKLHLPAIRW